MGQFDQAPFPMTHDDVENLIEAIQPTNVYVDLPVSIPTSGWSNSSPYVYTYTNSKITAECGIEVDFLANSENADVMYLEYEKVAGGVQFTAPKKPTVAIPVNIRVINADAEAFESISADMVSTNAVPGAANAEQALSTLNSNINAINGNTDQVIASGSDLNNYKTTGIWRIGNMSVLINNATIAGVGTTGLLYVIRIGNFIMHDFPNNGVRATRFSFDGGSTWDSWH